MGKEHLNKPIKISSECSMDPEYEKVELCKEKYEEIEKCCKIFEDDNLKFEKRVQFTVEAKSRKICSLLKALEYFGINIVAATLINGKHDENIFKFVVGQSDTQSRSDLLTTRYILKKECVFYSEDEVLKVEVRKSVTLTLSEIYCLLIKKIEVLSLYTAEDGDIIVEPSNLKYAERAIETL